MNGNTQRSDSSMTNDDTLARLEGQIQALESRLAYQEDWLDTLDQAVADKEKRLAHLERLSELMQRRLRDQQQALQELDDDEYHPEDEVPPHY